jgi:hypothetical protein
MLARHNARIAVRDEIKDEVTALLLACGMALAEPELNESTLARLRSIEEVANRIKEKLTVEEEEGAGTSATEPAMTEAPKTKSATA